MPSFLDAVSPIVAGHLSGDSKAALDRLGQELRQDLSALEPRQRVSLVDRLVRGLREVSVTSGPRLERELLRATHAEPQGRYLWPLNTAAGIIEVRAGLRYLSAWLGRDWTELSRLQAVICGLARWVQAQGKGTLEALVEPTAVRFTLRCEVPGLDPQLIESSPFVTAVSDVARDLTTSHDAAGVVLTFSLLAA